MIVEERRIDAGTADLTAVGYILVAGNGDLLVTQSQDGLIKIFRSDGSTTTMGRKGGGPGEFDRLTRAGFVGDSIWVLDPGLARISIFGPDYQLVRSFRSPDTGLETSSDFQTYVQAVLPGGGLRVLVTPRSGATPPPWLANVDSGSQPYARMDPSGNFVRLLAINPPDNCSLHWRIGTTGSAAMRLPFCARRISSGWDATVPLVLVDQGEVAGDSGSYRVTVISPDGDTTYSRSYGYQPIAVTPEMIDSARTRQAEFDAGSPPGYEADRPEITYPASLPPVRRVVLGRDGTVWLELQDNAASHRWIVLDGGGEQLGAVELPSNVTLRTADRSRLWTLERDADDLESIVVYRLELGS